MAEESSTGEAEGSSRHLSEHHCVHGAVSAEVRHSHLGTFTYEQERRDWRRLLGSTTQGLRNTEFILPMPMRAVFVDSTRDQKISFSDEDFCELGKALRLRCQADVPSVDGSWYVRDRRLYFEAPTATITCSQGHNQAATGPFRADDPCTPTSFTETIASKEWPCVTCGVNRSITVDPGPEDTKSCGGSCGNVGIQGIRQRTLGPTRID